MREKVKKNERKGKKDNKSDNTISATVETYIFDKTIREKLSSPLLEFTLFFFHCFDYFHYASPIIRENKG